MINSDYEYCLTRYYRDVEVKDMERDMKAYLKKVGKQDHDFPLSGGRYEWQLTAYYTEE